MKMEMHIHTRYSKDSLLCFWPLYLKCRLLNIDALAITEHNNIDGAKKFKNFCEKHGKRIFVIVGEEIFTSEGEVIGLYLSEPIAPGMTAEKTMDEIKKQNGVICVPHPYDEKRNKTVLKESVIAKNAKRIDCIEVYNGRNISSVYEEKQLEIAKKNAVPYIIGSDAHTWLEIGRNYIEIENVPVNPIEFRENIKTAVFHKRDCIWIAHQITKIVKILKLIMKGDYNAIFEAVNRRIKNTMQGLG